MSPTAKPHAVLIPFPANSHIKAMLKMARLLHSRGFHITFVNTDFNHTHMLETGGRVQRPGFRFVPLLDGLSPEASQDMAYVCACVRRDFLGLFRDVVDKINSNRTSEVAEVDSPPVTCMVSDGFTSFSITVAEELGIPVAVFFTISACSFMGLKQYRALMERGIVPLKGTPFYLLMDQ